MTNTDTAPDAWQLQVEAQLAFHDALGAIEPVRKTQTADTGKYKYSYADLGDVLDECKRACLLHGLALTQWPTAVDGMLALSTRLIHKNGGTVDFDPIMLPLPREAQPFGSALTYLRRYALLAIFGIAPEDDDGHAATQAARAPDQFGGYRSGAEERIHAKFTELDQDDQREARKLVQQKFRESFGCGLSDLPLSRHGDALEFVLGAIPLAIAEAEQRAKESTQG